MARRRPEGSAIKGPVSVDFYVRDHHRHHRFVYVDSCDPIRHTVLHGGAENVP